MNIRRTSYFCAFVFSAITAASPADSTPLSDAERVKIIDDYYDQKIAELKKYRDLDILYTKGHTAEQIRKTYKVSSRKHSTNRELAAPAKPDPAANTIGFPSNPCSVTSGVYVRRDRLDTFQFREQAVPLSDARGASISFSDNTISKTSALNINGRAGFFLSSPDPLAPCINGQVADPYTPFDPNIFHIGIDISPFVDAQGAANFPAQKSESSNLQFGIDFQSSVYGGPLFDNQFVVVTPYFQTDFHGIANVKGVQFGWEPVAPQYHLGGRIGVPNEIFDYYWQFRAEADVKDVENVGYTKLAKGMYRWLGFTSQIHLNLFPDITVFEPTRELPIPELAGLLFINGKAQFYWDERTGKSISFYEGEFGVNLSKDGKSSVSLRYNNGQDKDTLQKFRKYLLTLNYKL